MTLLLPCRFEAWDLDKDGYINVEEFAFTGHAKIESRSTRELFKKIDSDSKHERFKHFLILFWKRIHFVQRVMFASFKIYLSSKFTEEEAIMFMVTLLITVSDCQTRFARNGKANIVLITLPITVSDCQILFFTKWESEYCYDHIAHYCIRLSFFSTNWESEYCYPHIAYYCIRLSSSDHVFYLDINYSI